jgi:hypothetical protein
VRLIFSPARSCLGVGFRTQHIDDAGASTSRQATVGLVSRVVPVLTRAASAAGTSSGAERRLGGAQARSHLTAIVNQLQRGLP